MSSNDFRDKFINATTNNDPHALSDELASFFEWLEQAGSTINEADEVGEKKKIYFF